MTGGPLKPNRSSIEGGDLGPPGSSRALDAHHCDKGGAPENLKPTNVAWNPETRRHEPGTPRLGGLEDHISIRIKQSGSKATD